MTPTPEGLRERIAEALWMVDDGPKHVDDWWDEGTYEARKARYYELADAVLDALRLEQVGWWCDRHLALDYNNPPDEGAPPHPVVPVFVLRKGPE